MTAGDRRQVKIRRRGKHSSPSQVEKVAVQAGKAAPAVAIAGALVAAPQAQHALAASAKPATVTNQAHEAQSSKAAAAHTGAQHQSATLDSVSTHAVTVASTVKARHAARVGSTHYTVRDGDTLSKIAQSYYHRAADWGYLYHENEKKISDPNLIFVGESLVIPATVPANYTLTDYMPKHSRTVTSATVTSSTVTPAALTPAAVTPAPVTPSSGDASQGTETSGSTIGGASDGGTVVVQSSGGLSGTLGCSGLEQLWENAGGNPSDAFMAAEIAMAESGGNQYALSPTDDYGYWQINASNGALATYDAYGNARSAIILSHDGTDWYPWTTYTSGAYAGKC
jgi:LysM repeat protein